MKQYRIELHGQTPLIMHGDNLAFTERIKQWREDPANKEHSVAGDDRSPAWTWLGYLYHNRKVVGMPADNLMTMLREGGAKVKTGAGRETYKKHTQSGIIIDGEQWDLVIDGECVDVAPFDDLLNERDFAKHMDLAEKHGFELLIKRATVGRAKHVRVRPMFRTWKLVGSLTVIDEELSGLTPQVLETILNQAGALVGLGDWRPSSPSKSGTFGRFTPEVVPA